MQTKAGTPPGADAVRNLVKDKLARDEVVASMTVRLVRQVEIAQIARTAGFDSLYVDMEHSSASIETTSAICIAALGVGIAPFVRVPANTPEYITRVLEAGALGVIAPHVSSPAEARAVVAAAKFPPLGARSVASGLPHLHFRNLPAAQAYPALNGITTVMVQIESAAGLAAADAIAAVEGLDMVMVGTNDLLTDLGIPEQYDDPKVRDAYATVIAACRRHGKHVGVGGLAGRPALVAEFVRMGARYVSTGTDLGFLLDACTGRAKAVRELIL
jgi:4-hydroxy-2-oxoheptanedioate aldolase